MRTDVTPDIAAFESGAGRTILIVPPGLDDGAGWAAVAAALAPHARVRVWHRRRYRLDRPPECTLDQEIADVVALAADFDRPLVVGHSSGGVIALEALVAAPERFSGGVVYEPPVASDAHSYREAMLRASDAVAGGRVARAMRIFLAEGVRVPAWLAWLASLFIVLHPRYRAMAPRQIADAVAMEALGERFAAYRGIELPVRLIGGDQSPAHLGERLDLLARALPDSDRVTLRGQGHGANQKAPQALAEAILGARRRVG